MIKKTKTAYIYLWVWCISFIL